jgi:flagella basal body P-ring formation protein FlgA
MMFFLLAAAACITVDGDAIRMGDVARGIPSFAAVDPGIPVALAPAFGATRTFAPAEVSRLAARYDVDRLSLQGVCFERPSGRLDAGELREVLEGALPVKDTHLEVVDFAAYAVPVGTVTFAIGGLQTAAATDGTRLWRGRVEYGNHRSYPVWAKVRLRCRRSVVVAALTIHAASLIRASDVFVEEREADPGRSPLASRLEAVVGKVTRTRIAEGQGVPLHAVSSPPVVRRGEDIEVTVQSGQANLRLTATAQKAGKPGETIPVRNPVSGRIFPARVEGEHRAVAEGDRR